MLYKQKTFSGFIGGAGSLKYNFESERFSRSQGFRINDEGENLISYLLEQRTVDATVDFLSLHLVPTYYDHLGGYFFEYAGYQWLVCYFESGISYGIKVYRKTSSATSWTLRKTISNYDELVGCVLFNDRILITANHSTNGNTTIYSDDKFSTYTENTSVGYSFDMYDDDILHVWKDTLYKFNDSDNKLYTSTDGLNWTEQLDLSDDGDIVRIFDDGSFIYLLLEGGKTTGRLYRLYSDYTFDIVCNFSKKPTDVANVGGRIFITFILDKHRFLIGEIVEDVLVEKNIYAPPDSEIDDLEIEDVAIILADGLRLFIRPRWEDVSSPTVLYGDMDLKVKNRLIEFNIDTNSVFYVHQLAQGWNFLAGVKNGDVLSFLIEDNENGDHLFYEYHNQSLKYVASGEVETGIFEDGEMILKQIILRHDPLPANCSIEVYQKKDKASSWGSAILTSNTLSSVKKKYDYAKGQQCDFINFKVKLKTSDNLSSPKNISLTFLYKNQGLENSKS